MRRLVLLAVCLFSCRPVSEPDPPGAATLNACAEHSCDAYADAGARCSDAGLCVAARGGDLAYVLVVLPNQVSPLASQQFVFAPDSGIVSQNLVTTASYGAPSALLGDAAPDDAGEPVLLGARVVYRPLWPLPRGDTLDAGVSDVTRELVETPAAGIALEPVFAGLRRDPPPVDGPRYRALVQSERTYLRSVLPLAPFDELVPPETGRLVVRGVPEPVSVTDGGSAPRVRLDDIAVPVLTTPIKITRTGGTLDAFVATIVDSVTGDPVSTTVRLSSRDEAAQFRTLRNELRGVDLVVAPPPDAGAIPRLVAAIPGGTVPDFAYPELAPPVELSGRVLAPADSGSRAVSADIELESVLLTPVRGQNDQTPDLRLETRTVARDGSYRVTLRPGTYKMTVSPRDPVWAQRTQQIDVAAGGGSTDVRLARKAVLSARCTLVDGTAVGFADIDAVPSSRAYGAPGQPVDRPRPAHGRADAAGAIRLALDPGRYDLAIKPPEGSRFPWLVLVAREIGAIDVSLDPCTIPAPVAVATTLLVGDGNLNVPLATAVVRAFAVPERGRAWVEVGRSVTDRLGKLDLYLSSPSL